MQWVGVEKSSPLVATVHGGANRAVPAPVSVSADAGVPFLNKAFRARWQGELAPITRGTPVHGCPSTMRLARRKRKKEDISHANRFHPAYSCGLRPVLGVYR